MMTFLRDRLGLRPNPVGGTERLRAALGAFCGLLLTGLLTQWSGHNAAFLIAPMGASSVLLFCVPASPLAQPWSVIGGNIVSGLIGVACVQLLGQSLPLVALAPLAACLAIAAMMTLRCLHPPSGAVALTMVLGGPAVHAAGFGFVLAPVALNSILMVAAAVAYNRLTGRVYPHKAPAPVPQANTHATKDPLPTARLGFNLDDLDAVLRRYGQVLDIGRDDLSAILKQTEMQAYGRRFGVITCADIMSKDALTTEPGTDLATGWRLMQAHRFEVLPVLDQARGVVGIVSQNDFLRHSDLGEFAGLGARVRDFLQPGAGNHLEKAETVGQIMARHPKTARAGAPILDLVPLLADSGMHHVLIVGEDGCFVGIVSQSDLVAALYQSRFTEMREAAPVA
jgi:CBS domain-containing membrane protein